MKEFYTLFDHGNHRVGFKPVPLSSSDPSDYNGCDGGAGGGAAAASGGSGPSPAYSTTAPPAGRTRNHSTGPQIGLGVGLGLGVPMCALLACWLQRQHQGRRDMPLTERHSGRIVANERGVRLTVLAASDEELDAHYSAL